MPLKKFQVAEKAEKPTRASQKSRRRSRRGRRRHARSPAVRAACASCASSIADEQGVPPYVVFTDATLQEMAREQPTNRVAMLARYRA
ncbi:MAG: HRDC domain-containing protein [Hymenobacter sp.]